MDHVESDWAARLGDRIAWLIIALIAAFMAYGFLGTMLFG